MVKYHQPTPNGPNLIVANWPKVLKNVFKNKTTRSLIHLQKAYFSTAKTHRGRHSNDSLNVNIRNESG